MRSLNCRSITQVGLNYMEDSYNRNLMSQLATETCLCPPGLFTVVSDEMPYSSLEEMLSLRPVGLDSCLPFIFISHSNMTIDNFTLGADRELTVLSIEQHEGEESQVRCHVKGQQGASAEVCIPLSFRGEFYECKSEESFSLQEIMTSPYLRSRRFHFINRTMCERQLVLSPIYQVHAIMHCELSAVYTCSFYKV